MSSSSRPLLYLVLGCVGSGRREVVADLIDNGLEADEQGAVVAADTEAGATETVRWTLDAEGGLQFTPPAGATHVFVLLDGRADPVPALQAWSRALAGRSGVELARVVTVVHCALAEANPGLLPWFDACVHFSDLVLLNRREGVANKWVSDFVNRYKNQFMPCLFEPVKNGRVKNPGLVLQPEARRMSHAFEPDDWAGLSLEGVEFGIEDGDEVTPVDRDELLAGTDDESSGLDPYFELDASGHRVKRLPDIARHLPAADVG